MIVLDDEDPSDSPSFSLVKLESTAAASDEVH
jgi:hypothetical protein